MRTFNEFVLTTGKITRRGTCDVSIIPSPRAGCAIAFIASGHHLDTITADGVDGQGVAIQPVLHEASSIDKEGDLQKVRKPRRIIPQPNPIPDEDKPTDLTRKEVALLMQRVKDLEDKASGNP